jgi:hypothetical protein
MRTLTARFPRCSYALPCLAVVSAFDILQARLFRNKDALPAMLGGQDLNEDALSRRQALWLQSYY